MVIVFVLDVYDKTANGTTVSARRFADSLRDKGHEVRIVSTGREEQWKYVVRENHFPVLYHFCKKQGFVFGKPDIKVLRKAFEGADIVHLFLPLFLERKALRVACDMGIPCCGAFHLQPENITFNIHLKYAGWLSSAIYKWMRGYYNKFSHIHCPSEFIASQLRLHGYRSELHVISNGISPEFRPSGIRKENAGFNILCIGRISPEKRQDLLIKACAESKHADRIQLFFAGAGGWEEHLRSLSEKLPNKPVFAFYEKEQLIDIIRKSDLYVHASDVDIEAISCLEAIACGLVPVISDSPKSATSQFAIDERSLFKAGDHKDLAKKIDYWLDDPEERKRMSQIYAEYPDKYKLSNCVDAALDMFRKTITDMERRIVSESRFFKAFRWGFYYLIAIPALSTLDQILFGLRIEGRDNLDTVRNAIVVCNHMHYLDSTMIACASVPHRMNYATLDKNINSPLSGFIVRLFSVPVGEDIRGRRTFLQRTTERLRQGEWFVIFPEGELVLYCDHLRPFNKGAFLLAVRSGVPVVPMVITQREPEGIFSLYKSKPLLTVKIGEPIRQPEHLDERRSCEYLMNTAYAKMSTMFEDDDPGLETVAQRHAF